MDRTKIWIDADTAAHIATAGERCGIPDGMVVKKLAELYADELTPVHFLDRPPGTRGRRGFGRRPKESRKSA